MEREEELEVLHSIYDDRLSVINELEYKIKISTNNVVGDLNITLGKEYPLGDNAIKYSFVANGGTNRIRDNVALRRVVGEEISRSSGDVAIFNLVCCLEEYIMDKNNISSVVGSDFIGDDSEGEGGGGEGGSKKEVVFVDIPLTMEGGPVNKETYDKWWIEFSSANCVKKDLSTTRLTGREMFEQNKQLATSYDASPDSDSDDELELDQLSFKE